MSQSNQKVGAIPTNQTPVALNNLQLTDRLIGLEVKFGVHQDVMEAELARAREGKPQMTDEEMGEFITKSAATIAQQIADEYGIAIRIQGVVNNDDPNAEAIIEAMQEAQTQGKH